MTTAIGRFLDIQAHPTMTYRSTGVRHSEDGFDVDGELTLHGVTRQVPLALVVNGFTGDPFGGTRAGFSATAAIDRKDFAITTNIPMDGGGVVIGDTIQIFIEIEAVLSPPVGRRSIEGSLSFGSRAPAPLSGQGTGSWRPSPGCRRLSRPLGGRDQPARATGPGGDHSGRRRLASASSGNVE